MKNKKKPQKVLTRSDKEVCAALYDVLKEAFIVGCSEPGGPYGVKIMFQDLDDMQKCHALVIAIDPTTRPLLVKQGLI